MSVQVDTSNDATNYFCGGHFGVMSGAMTSGVVRCEFQLFCEKGMRHNIWQKVEASSFDGHCPVLPPYLPFSSDVALHCARPRNKLLQ